MHRISPSLSIYLGSRFLIALGGAFALIAGLILLFDSIELLRRAADLEAVGGLTVIGLALLKLPHTVQDALPFMVMLAMMYALFRHSRHYELVVMRSAGISAWQVLTPSMVLVVALGLANLFVFNPVAASLYDIYGRLERRLIDPKATALDIGASGFWLREATPTGAAVVHADTVQQDGSDLHFDNVIIFVSDAKDNLSHRIEADSGDLGDGVFHLTGVRDLEPGKPVARYATYDQPTTITFAQVQDSFAAPETLSFWDLPAFVATSRAAGFSALPHRLYWQSLLASPVMLCAMVLVAAAFYMTAQTRLGGWTVRTLGGIAAGFLLYFFSRFTYALGLSTTLPIGLAAWSPAIVALLLSLTYLFYREDG
ncbi:MAG: LptF/LptG family permease [Rhodobacteraceae bacterium]|nr:LptF/LptG family permease [Planctomycetales bacterium]MCB2109057.1 LptF/LptG family permease [Paracoccaceae bacterium]